jgi:hypothetical protein
MLNAGASLHTSATADIVASTLAFTTTVVVFTSEQLPWVVYVIV